MGDEARHPMQPIVIVDGVARFRANAIVRYLLDEGPFDMNHLAARGVLAPGEPFSREDRSQFAQLIGYSVSGYGDLPYADPATVADADAAVEALGSAAPRADPPVDLDALEAIALVVTLRERAGWPRPGAGDAIRAAVAELRDERARSAALEAALAQAREALRAIHAEVTAEAFDTDVDRRVEALAAHALAATRRGG